MLATHKLPPPTFTINEIVSAIKRDEFMAFYQPQIDLHSYELSGIELLARWQHPCHGLLAPPQIFPSIVNAGLFNELSHSLIRQALSTQNNLLGQGLDFPLSINLEPSQISDSSFINTMIEQIDQGALSRRPLIIDH
ncbi:EAL domain-containing protein [Pseudomonas syringae pv. actinidiae]|uniref:C-di-GMP-specific phosphodiesterase class I n=2 Tax=Pseudomonas syringae TaxID=317 RepID=A0AAN4Q6B5_PSESF|nr:EAL domain-containing protein [Pseudomonas syringae]MDG6394812.1 EAL domain-containing protein [Pseudomonas syringae pv. actinidiae]MDG6413135.1 EAL domain-containing protein [Pseudomonas syringae pv. actinidiae]MDG6418506.1 EAL domain-containing protein [Pseudomonas syringae pv. actinidiae]MDG6434110.1 EAL domain-containing protein [Pseudomonas syringae pv. actinidiae]MDG6439438.1 EAL domain-containing protein [Pseudomonas syringae pv. actinidiae]